MKKLKDTLIAVLACLALFSPVLYMGVSMLSTPQAVHPSPSPTAYVRATPTPVRIIQIVPGNTRPTPTPGRIAQGVYGFTRSTPRPTYRPAATSRKVAYIGNRNTGKFHKPGCASVGQMKQSNKVSLYSRQEAIDKGYVPCQRCHP